MKERRLLNKEDSFMLGKVSRYQKFAPLFLRLGLAIVFILFGLQKLANPLQTTAEIQLLVGLELADAAAINYYLGLAEILVAFSFLFGFKVRFFAGLATLLVTLFFLSILSKYGLSINPDLYRDIGIIGASISLFLQGAGPLSIDELVSKKEKHDEQVS